MADEKWIESSLAALEELENERVRLEQRLEDETNPDTLRHISSILQEVDQEIERLYAALNAIADESESESVATEPVDAYDDEPDPEPTRVRMLASEPEFHAATHQESVVVDVSGFIEEVDDDDDEFDETFEVDDFEEIEELEPDDLEEMIVRQREQRVPVSHAAVQPAARSARPRSDTLVLSPTPAPVSRDFPPVLDDDEDEDDGEEQTVVRDVRSVMMQAATSGLVGRRTALRPVGSSDTDAASRSSRRSVTQPIARSLEGLGRTRAVASRPTSQTSQPRTQAAQPNAQRPIQGAATTLSTPASARPVSPQAHTARGEPAAASPSATMDPAAKRAVATLITQLEAAAEAARTKLSALSDEAAAEERSLSQQVARADAEAKQAEAEARAAAAEAQQLAAQAKRARAIAMAAVGAQAEAASTRAREIAEAEAAFERANRAAKAAAANPQSLLKLKSVQRQLAAGGQRRPGSGSPRVSAAG